MTGEEAPQQNRRLILNVPPVYSKSCSTLCVQMVTVTVTGKKTVVTCSLHEGEGHMVNRFTNKTLVYKREQTHEVPSFCVAGLPVQHTILDNVCSGCRLYVMLGLICRPVGQN